MEKRIKTIRRFNQLYRSLSFSELMKKADEEFLESVIRLDEQGHPIEDSKFDSSGNLEENNRFSYTSSGKLTEHVLHYAVDDVTERRVLRRDDKERLLEEIRYYGDDTGERLEYRYDDKDRVVSLVRFDEEGDHDYTEAYEYDGKDRLVSRIRNDRNGNPIERSGIERKDDHELIEQEFDGLDGLRAITSIRFDAKGNEVAAEQRKPDGKLISAVYTDYDESGKVLERRYKDFYSKTVRYAYDENGRMVSQELFDGSGLMLRKNVYEYDSDGLLINEQVFEIDASRGGRDKHFGTRYEYEFHQ